MKYITLDFETYYSNFFLDPKCLECRREAATEADKLARLLAGKCEEDTESESPEVGIINCAKDAILCEVFVRNQYSRPIYINHRTVSQDPEPVSAENLAKFVKEGVFTEHILGDLETIVIQGERRFFDKLEQSKEKEAESIFWFIPEFVSFMFDSMFRSPIAFLYAACRRF